MAYHGNTALQFYFIILPVHLNTTRSVYATSITLTEELRAVQVIFFTPNEGTRQER